MAVSWPIWAKILDVPYNNPEEAIDIMLGSIGSHENWFISQ